MSIYAVLIGDYEKQRIKSLYDNKLKSILVSGLVLYSFLFDNEPKEGRQLFCAANDKSQASIVFNMVAKQLMYFVSKVPELKKDVKKVRELLTQIGRAHV